MGIMIAFALIPNMSRSLLRVARVLKSLFIDLCYGWAGSVLE